MIEQTLARLKRGKVWHETARSHGMVSLACVRFGTVFNEDLPESDLNELLKSGAVKCDSSTRLFEYPSYAARSGIVEVTVKYWSVA